MNSHATSHCATCGNPSEYDVCDTCSMQASREACVETLHWIDVSDETPDDSIVVLIATPGGDEPTWLGYIDGGAWHYNNAMRVDVAVTAWAELPAGPQRSEGES